MHPALAPVEFLLGTWEGAGKGVYSSIDPFTYREEVSFTHVGRPFLIYSQRTWNDAGQPMHAETGYWRFLRDARVELVLAHPTGIVEIEEGSVAGTALDLSSTLVRGTSTAKEVRTLARRLTVDGDVLRYTLDMEAVEQPMQRHLEAELRRTAS